MALNTGRSPTSEANLRSTIADLRAVEAGDRVQRCDPQPAGRPRYGFDRAVFFTVLHRLSMSGSDRSACAWQQEQAGTEDLKLHQL